MFRKRTILAMGLGAAAMWYADPVSGSARRATLRRALDDADDTTRAISTLPQRGFPDPSPPPPPPRSTATDSNSSLREVLSAARRHGIDADMSPTSDGLIRCGGCGCTSRPEDMSRDWVHRLEGTSDPDEMLSASAIGCPGCGRTGVLVLPFGPLANETESQISRSLPAPRHAGMAPLR